MKVEVVQLLPEVEMREVLLLVVHLDHIGTGHMEDHLDLDIHYLEVPWVHPLEVCMEDIPLQAQGMVQVHLDRNMVGIHPVEEDILGLVVVGSLEVHLDQDILLEVHQETLRREGNQSIEDLPEVLLGSCKVQMVDHVETVMVDYEEMGYLPVLYEETEHLLVLVGVMELEMGY